MSADAILPVREAWRRYVQDDALDLRNLRAEVASSWQRCHNLRIDPLQRGQASVIDSLQLKKRLFYNEHLIRIARPFMERLYNFVKGTGFQVVLTDETGFLLEVLGDLDIVSRTAHVQLCPGGDWSEASKGTNAIGTAIYERRPVQIYASEHYCEANHFLTCSAAPIFGADGDMVGVLDLSGDYHFATPHTLGMVVAAVGAIENELRLRRATDQLYMAYRYSNTILESMSDGLISVDNNGLIKQINAKGAQILGVDARLIKGRHISQVAPPYSAIAHLLDDGSGEAEREVIFDSMGRRIRSSASLLRDDTGAVIGAVALFREVGERPLTARRRPAQPSRLCVFDDIVGESASITDLKAWARRAAASSSTVLIEGESGTGKELFAEAIHSGGSRRERRLVAINCAAIPENLIESELFGYEEGSFTGARKGGQAGKFELAEGGTLFLDEVGDMPLSVQMKLLRAIQEKSVTHIGSATERPVDIRLIAATNKNLSAEVQQGRFRQDLYYRLHVVTMRIPPLRERPEDIPALARHLAGRLAERLRFSPVQMEPAFLEKLQSYAWPGNVRELENAIERAMVEAGDGIPLTTELLEFDAPGSPARSAAAADGSLKSLDEVEAETIRQALLFAVGMGTCGRGNGAEGVYHAFADLISRTGMDVQSGKQDLPI